MIGFGAGIVRHSFVPEGNAAALAGCCLLEANSWRGYQTIFPSSSVHSIQGAPRSVMTSLSTGIINHSFIPERNATALAGSCLVEANSWRWYQAIFPSSFIHRIQRTPRPVVIYFGAGIVRNADVLERNAAAFTGYCLLMANQFWCHLHCKKDK